MKELLSKAIDEYSKKVWIAKYTEIDDPIDRDSFVYNKFIGNEEDRFNSNDNARRFIMQYKHPVTHKYYRLYIADKDMYETEISNQKNGISIFIKEYANKPEINIIEKHTSSDEYPMDIIPGAIEFEQVNYLPTELVMDQLGLENSRYDEIEETLINLGLVTASSLMEDTIIDGYPIWLQETEIPEGYDKTDFKFQISSNFEHGILFGDMGIIYVYEKDGEFGVTWQMT